jgi:iron complex transport system ATP-binding protein
MLFAKNISFNVGATPLLQDISVQFQPRKINLIIGPNGAGKSTLVKILSGQLKPATGEVLYGGKNIAGIPVAEQARFRAVLSQNMELAFPLTVREVVMMGRYPHFDSSPRQTDKDICEEAMRFFDITGFVDRNYMTLSGGEKQRVHFARVVAQIWAQVEGQPRFLLLDEPLTFLDVYYQFGFMNKLCELAKQQNLVIAGVVHDLNLVGKYADYLVLLNEGKILAEGSKQSVLTENNLYAAYKMKAEIQPNGSDIRLFF